jgi:hypothetical protein
MLIVVLSAKVMFFWEKREKSFRSTCGEVKKMIIFNYILPQVHKNYENWQNIRYYILPILAIFMRIGKI